MRHHQRSEQQHQGSYEPIDSRTAWGEQHLRQREQRDQHQDPGECHIDAHGAVHPEACPLHQRLRQAIDRHRCSGRNEYAGQRDRAYFPCDMIHQQEKECGLKHIAQIFKAAEGVHRRHGGDDGGQVECRHR